MVKLEWGTKRQCLGCTARFYDMTRTPIVCPKCGEVHEVQQANRRGRNRAAAEEAKLAALTLDEIVLDADLDLDVGDVLEDDDDDGLIEDTSDLVEDIDDMAEVVDHIDEDSDR